MSSYKTCRNPPLEMRIIVFSFKNHKSPLLTISPSRNGSIVTFLRISPVNRTFVRTEFSNIMPTDSFPLRIYQSDFQFFVLSFCVCLLRILLSWIDNILLFSVTNSLLVTVNTCFIMLIYVSENIWNSIHLASFCYDFDSVLEEVELFVKVSVHGSIVNVPFLNDGTSKLCVSY